MTFCLKGVFMEYIMIGLFIVGVFGVLTFNSKKSKEEYETENKKMNDKYTELHDLMGDEYVDYGETCFPRHYYSNLENFQEKWLKFREDEALFYSELENKKDEKIYFGKLFEITKKQNEYFEDIINNIKKAIDIKKKNI